MADLTGYMPSSYSFPSGGGGIYGGNTGFTGAGTSYNPIQGRIAPAPGMQPQQQQPNYNTGSTGGYNTGTNATAPYQQPQQQQSQQIGQSTFYGAQPTQQAQIGMPQGIDPRLAQLYQQYGVTPGPRQSGFSDWQYWQDKMNSGDANYYLGRLGADLGGWGQDTRTGQSQQMSGFNPSSMSQFWQMLMGGNGMGTMPVTPTWQRSQQRMPNFQDNWLINQTNQSPVWSGGFGDGPSYTTNPQGGLYTGGGQQYPIAPQFSKYFMGLAGGPQPYWSHPNQGYNTPPDNADQFPNTSWLA